MKGFVKLKINPDYLINKKGEVYSTKTNKYLKQFKSKYLGVSLYSGSRKSIKRYLIHRLVAMQFIPNVNNLPCVNHIDGDTHNNNVTNLEWCTYKQNSHHAIRLGRMNGPNRSWSTKLGSKDVIKIRKLYKQGMKQKQLGSMYNVSPSTISDVVNYVTFRKV